STAAGSFSTSRSAGSAARSPFWARSVRSINLSSSFGLVVAGAVALLTSFPPFAALVLVVAGGEQRGAGQQIGPLRQGRQLRVQRGQLTLLVAQGQGGEAAPLPLQRVHLRGQFGHPSGPDVLAHDAAVDPPRPGVVAAALPAHVCYPPAFAPPSQMP